MTTLLPHKPSSTIAGLALGLCLLSDPGLALAADPPEELSSLKYITVDGVERAYRVHVPPNLNREVPVPLMVDVHPLGGNPRGQAANTRYDLIADAQAAEEDRFITVYPLGTGNGWLEAYSWNGGSGWSGGEGLEDGCCGVAVRENVDDIHFLEQLIEEMKKQYTIDAGRIYGSGFSNGAALVQRAILDRPQLFTAAFVISQFLVQAVPEEPPAISVPIMVSHGSADTVAPYGGGSKFPTGPENFETWAKLNGCDRTAGPETGDIGLGTECSTYSQCGGSEVKMCLVFKEVTSRRRADQQNLHNHYNYTNEDGERLPEIGWSFVSRYRRLDDSTLVQTR